MLDRFSDLRNYLDLGWGLIIEQEGVAEEVPR